MYMMTQRLRLLMLSILCLTSLIYTTNYITMSTVSSKESIYELSDIALAFSKQSESVDPSAFYNQFKHAEVTLVSEYNDESFVGLYDPQFKYAEDMQVSADGIFRYFSDQDYAHKTHSGIIVFPDTVDLLSTVDLCKANKTALIEDVIFCVNRSSTLGAPNVAIQIVNQMALSTLGDTVYVDTEDASTCDEIARFFLSKNYTQIAIAENVTENPYSISTALRNPKVLSFVVTTLMMYAVFSLACFAYVKQRQRSIRIHLTSGASFGNALKQFTKYYLIANTIGTAVVLGVFIGVKSVNANFISSLAFYSVVCTSHLVLTSMMFLIPYAIEIKNATHTMKGDGYVR